MLDKKELEKFRAILGFNLAQIEKDYLQHLFLLFLSRQIRNELVFKGGTALQKIYGLNRFSRDLDFTLNKEIEVDQLIKKISVDISNFGFTSKIDYLKKGNSRLRIKGPLYDGTDRTIASLRIEISLRKDLLLEADLKEIVPIYTDMQPYLILVMNIEEILAEKIRAILQREKARDVYDMWFLLRKNVRVDFNLINKKLEPLGLKFNKNMFLKKIKIVNKIWEKELLEYISVVPKFEDVLKEIKGYL